MDPASPPDSLGGVFSGSRDDEVEGVHSVGHLCVHGRVIRHLKEGGREGEMEGGGRGRVEREREGDGGREGEKEVEKE